MSIIKQSKQSNLEIEVRKRVEQKEHELQVGNWVEFTSHNGHIIQGKIERLSAMPSYCTVVTKTGNPWFVQLDKSSLMGVSEYSPEEYLRIEANEPELEEC